MEKQGDLKPDQFPKLSWKPENALESLDRLYDYVTQKATKAINWYYEKKQWKRCMGCFLRYNVILFTAFAGVIPILGTIYKKGNIPVINPAWATIAIAIAATMIAVDKFGGFTSGWVRYVLSAQEIEQAIEDFRFSWQKAKLRLNNPPKGDEIQNMIVESERLLTEVQKIIRTETQKWITEFQTAIKEVEEAAKLAAKASRERAEIERYGAISFEVENGMECVDGWQLIIDNRTEKHYTGKRASVTAIKPGIVNIQIIGEIKGKKVRDNKAVKIKGGEISQVSFMLE